MKRMIVTLAVCLACAVGVAPAFAGAPYRPGIDTTVGGDGGGSFPLMGASCSGWWIGYCIERGKVVPCRCAKVLVCGVYVWMYVPANTPPA